MGRVSRYKKVKKSLTSATGGKSGTHRGSGGETIWGYTDCGRKPKKRSLTVLKLRARNNKKRKRSSDDDDGFDLEVTGGDDFDLHDLVGSIRKERMPVVDEQPPKQDDHSFSITKVPEIAMKEETSKSNIIPKEKHNDHDHVTPSSSSLEAVVVEEAKLLKSLEKQIEPVAKSGIVTDLGRKPGESKRAYNKRVKLETRLIIQNTKKSSRNPEKQQRKKEFMKNKKKLKKKRNNQRADDDDDDDSEDDEYRIPKSGTNSIDPPVVFGEQAERPPIFKVLPRGAVPKPTKKNNHNNSKNSSSKNKQTSNISSEEMEIMRRKVQAQYSSIKAQRRQTGANFHL